MTTMTMMMMMNEMILTMEKKIFTRRKKIMIHLTVEILETKALVEEMLAQEDLVVGEALVILRREVMSHPGEEKSVVSFTARALNKLRKKRLKI